MTSEAGLTWIAAYAIDLGVTWCPMFKVVATSARCGTELLGFFLLGPGSWISSTSPRAEDGEVKIDLYVYKMQVSREFKTLDRGYLNEQITFEEACTNILRIAIFSKV